MKISFKFNEKYWYFNKNHTLFLHLLDVTHLPSTHHPILKPQPSFVSFCVHQRFGFSCILPQALLMGGWGGGLMSTAVLSRMNPAGKITDPARVA